MTSISQKYIGYEDLPDTFTLEALAIRNGLMMARKLGAQNLAFESDNLSPGGIDITWEILCSNIGGRGLRIPREHSIAFLLAYDVLLFLFP